MRRNRKNSVMAGALLALGCGGDAVDLGDGQSKPNGWADLPDVSTPHTKPQQLYASNEAILGFTLDQGTLYALVDHDLTAELISCPLERCASQRKTLFNGPKLGDAIGQQITMVVADEQVFWAFNNGGLVSCWTTGCDALNRVGSAWGGGCLTNDGTTLYWLDRDKFLQRLDARADEPRPVQDLTGLVEDPQYLAVQGDYLYLGDQGKVVASILRLNKDGKTDPKLIVEDESISGLSGANGSLYYSSQILSGRIVECTADDCTTTLTTQRWPREVRVEGDEAFWLTASQTALPAGRNSLWSCRLPGCAEAELRVADFAPKSWRDATAHEPTFAVNQQSLVWVAARESGGSRLQRMSR